MLVVDDDPDHLALVERWLRAVKYRVATAPGGGEALALIERERPSLVISDLRMDAMDGLRLLSEVHRQDPVMPFVIVSGHAEIPDALEAAHLGVSAFFTKPVARYALLNELEHILQSAAHQSVEPAEHFARQFVYRSTAMGEVLQRARRVAAADSTVLIVGETGTGKELLARAIHDASARAKAPFVSINCSALPEHLLESELFGHEKGAFTGALTKHVGLFQAADGGTLFLDEIGDMPLPLQAKLLRVLQDFQVRPVGSTQSVAIDVRVISATHRQLQRQVDAGEFREDLYYRLNVVPLRLPALRERREDIPLLVEHFLAGLSDEDAAGRKRFAPAAMDYLVAARLPGNVRQLKNVVEQCVVFNPSGIIPLGLVSEALGGQPDELAPLDEAKSTFERRYLTTLLRANQGNVAKAARAAGRNRTEFYNLLQRHNLDPESFRGGRRSPREDD